VKLGLSGTHSRARDGRVHRLEGSGLLHLGLIRSGLGGVVGHAGRCVVAVGRVRSEGGQDERGVEGGKERVTSLVALGELELGSKVLPELVSGADPGVALCTELSETVITSSTGCRLGFPDAARCSTTRIIAEDRKKAAEVQQTRFLRLSLQVALWSSEKEV